MTTKLNNISARSRKDCNSEFYWMMKHFTVENLTACFNGLDGKKAIGIDGVTKEEYGENLDSNLEGLINRMKSLSYRPKPNKVVHIPKATGGKRKLAISAIEDKIVQTMFASLLEAMYEPTFESYSYAFRPNRSCHDAIARIRKFLFKERMPTIYEIDFEDFFGSIDHEKMLDVLGMRIKDDVFIRYISRILKTGEFRDGNQRANKTGLQQGNIVSPILANIFAHYAIDRWFEPSTSEICRYKRDMVRFCDDAVFLFSNKYEAEAFKRILESRIERFGLKLNEDKCKLLKMDKSDYINGRKQETFAFLGFTFFLAKSKEGRVVPKVKSDPRKVTKKLKEIKMWLHKVRTILSLKQTWDQLRVILRGYANYFAISFNAIAVGKFKQITIKLFYKSMNRRSQKKSISWSNLASFMKQYPVPYVPTKKVLF